MVSCFSAVSAQCQSGAEPTLWPAIMAAVLPRVSGECAVAVHVVEAAGRTHRLGLHGAWLSVAAWACAGAGAGVCGAGHGLAAAHLRPPGHQRARSAAGARPALVGDQQMSSVSM